MKTWIIRIILFALAFWLGVWADVLSQTHAQPAGDSGKSTFNLDKEPYNFWAKASDDTIVTFTDGADLQRQVQEIGAVCDTAVSKIYNQTYYDFKGSGVAIKDTMFIFDIRCRTNVQVRIVLPPERIRNAEYDEFRKRNKIQRIPTGDCALNEYRLRTIKWKKILATIPMYNTTTGEALITWEWE